MLMARRANVGPEAGCGIVALTSRMLAASRSNV